MANFLILVDPDLQRRARVIRAIEPLLAPFGGLSTDRCDVGDFCCVWAAERRAPVSRHTSAGSAAILWGDAFRASDSARADALELKRRWQRVTESPPAAFNGYHAATFYDGDGTLVVGADLLGFFPVYYYVSRDVALVGSSPELFRHHPLVEPELDPCGLAGVLLTNGLVGGRTLLRDIRRLAAGRVLSWAPGQLPQEIEQYEIPRRDEPRERSLASTVELTAAVLDRAVAETLPAGEPWGLLLSGGLDSRTLAAFSDRRAGRVHALTIGSRAALETRCAARVARELGCDHRVVDISEAAHPRFAQLQARWEHCANGLNNLWFWGLPPHLWELPPRVGTGLALDCALGGPLVTSKQRPAVPLCFEAVLSQMNSWAVPVEALDALLRAEVFGDALEQTVERLHALYHGHGESEFKRAWRMELLHRQRFHVGGIAWQLSFGAWPVLPVLNQGLLELAASLPERFHANRLVQKELLVRCFPRLASIPLCRNEHRTDLLLPTPRARLSRWVTKRISRLGLRPRALGGARQRARRLFYPLYDFDGVGWKAVRQRAERNRARVTTVFDEGALYGLLPPPDDCVPSRLPLDSSGKKLLVGLVIWSEENLRHEATAAVSASSCVSGAGENVEMSSVSESTSPPTLPAPSRRR